MYVQDRYVSINHWDVAYVLSIGIPNSVTLNDPERRNSAFIAFTEFGSFRSTLCRPISG